MREGAFAANEALRGHWYAVARADDVGAEPVAVTLLGQRLVLWRSATDGFTAAPDRCPHREAPLSAGSVHDGCVVCPYHGWTFDGDGRCVRVPSSGDGAPVPPKAHLRPLHCTERYGLVWVCPGEPVGTIPEIAEDDDPSYRRINVEVQHWAASATRMVDNFMDYSHFPYVHLGSFGGATDPRVAPVELEDLGGFYGYRYSVEASNAGAATTASGVATGTVTRTMSTGFALPLSVRSTIGYDTGLNHILLLLSTPVDDSNALFTFVVWRNDDFSVPPEEVIRLDRSIGAEDQRMLEQLEGPLPLGATDLVSVQADRPSVEWRRRFIALLQGTEAKERGAARSA